MPTVPLGENPYLYTEGPTVPLRQQRTGTYAANSFGNRVFYTSPGTLPTSTLGPGLAPTAGQLLRQNLSGAGLAGAAIGGGLAAQGAYSQGAGLFQGVGVGVGTVAGAVGGQAAGAAVGSAAGGAAGSAVPVVGNVAGAGAGTVVGAVGGGLVGGAVGGNIGGGIGQAIDQFFWPSPAQPSIGIPPQPGDVNSPTFQPGYDNQFPAGAAGAGPEVVPGDPIYGPPPFTGGQTAGVGYKAAYSVNVKWTYGDRTYIAATTNQTAVGPISFAAFQLATNKKSLNIAVQGVGGANIFALARNTPGSGMASDSVATILSFSVGYINLFRADGQPDTGGSIQGPQVGTTEPERGGNPYRPLGTDGAGRSLPSTEPERSTDLPWPQTPINSYPVPSPFPTPIPTTDPKFAPSPPTIKPDTPTETTTRPTAPYDPLSPGPSRPLDDENESPVRPFFIPIPIGPINPPDFIPPQVPVTVPSGFRQPATTPTGSSQGLIDPTQTPTQNPNVQPAPQSTPQPARIEEGSCCIPPANPELIKRLEQIKKGIGVDGLPASVPDQIAKQNPGQIMINSLAELHLWQVQQFDGVMGRWPQQIPIPTPTGTVNVGMPNMAEAVAEMVGMMVSQQVTAAQILNTSSRAMIQAGSATQQAHLAHLTAKANADFLGFESRANAVDMPLAYTPGANPFDGLLQESTAKIQGFENTDGQDLKSILAELLQAAAIIRAVYWRKLDPRGDLKTQIRQNIRGQGDFIDEAAAGGNDDAWAEYLRQVEQGFRDATGDSTPYNRPPAEGPQIRDRSPGPEAD